ncbi:MAG: M81 family metallopeptidase [Acidimicrobiia bacterium]
MTRIGIAGIWHETNTYSVRPTDLDAFEAFEHLTGEQILGAHQQKGSVIGGMLDHDWFDPVPLMTAGAWPAGRVTRAAIDHHFATLDTELRRAGQLDGLLLDLHGAMVSEGQDDTEKAIVTLVRRAVGDIPVVAVHDLHGNPSPGLVGLCDALIAYDTYPHVDMRERGREAAEILQQILNGARLRTLVSKVPMLISPLAQGTDTSPMSDLKARASVLEGRKGIRRISLLPGFPYADVARAGFSVVVVYAEGAEKQARLVGDELATDVEKHSEDWLVERNGPATAVREAIDSAEQPVVLVDVADNIGGGSPGDGTALLGELVAQGATGAVVCIADADVALQADKLGEGTTLEAEVGGKTDKRHGDPVSIRGRVHRLTDGRYRSAGTWQTGRDFSMGSTAVLEVGGVTLVVMERATPPFHAEQLLSVGIDPAEASIITAKGAIAWRSAYGDVAARVIEVDTPGICPIDPLVLDRTTEPMRV